MYLWFMCIFISYKNILLNKERESENSDSSIHCTFAASRSYHHVTLVTQPSDH